MCTVTLIPLGESNFVLTSNRDEAPNRKTQNPDIYKYKDENLLYPKDELAGGTWIGLSEKNRLICLLNGGFTSHKRQESYRMSRGVVVKDLLASEAIEAAIKKYNFNNIEPFTMVFVDWNESLRFYELVWDGKQKHVAKLPLEPKIWSSSTLYSEAMKVERKHWFEVFKNEVDLNPKSLLNFHKNTNKENTEYGIVMDRGFVKTTSITQVEKQNHAAEMRFYNLQENTDSKSRLSFLNTIND